MKEKFWSFWNRPITWGDSIKYSVYGMLISWIGALVWLFGVGKLEKEVAKIKQRTEEDVKEAKRKAHYYEVVKEDVEE